jgi:hypothetical protein
MTTFRQIEAKFSSNCFICRTPLPKGSNVWWKKGHRVRCDECTPQEERALFGSVEARRRHASREADERRRTVLDSPFTRLDREDAETRELIERLEAATEPEAIHALIDAVLDTLR